MKRQTTVNFLLAHLADMEKMINNMAFLINENLLPVTDSFELKRFKDKLERKYGETLCDIKLIEKKEGTIRVNNV